MRRLSGVGSLWQEARANWGVATLLGVLAVSLALNVHLALKMRRSSGPVGGNRVVGLVLPPVEVRSIDGRSEVLSFTGGRRTIVYALTPDCVWCARNQANIKSLTAAVGERYGMIGLAIRTDFDTLKRYLAAEPLPFPVFLVESEEWLDTVSLHGTPATLVVDASGMVERFWTGAYTGGLGPQVERFLGAKLPGLIVDKR